MPDEMSPNGSDMGNAGPKEGSFNPAVAGSLMGGNNLQKAIDSNTKAMDDLASQIKSMGGSKTFSQQGPTSTTASGVGGFMRGMQPAGPYTNMGGALGSPSQPAPMLGQMGQQSPGGGGFQGQFPTMGPTSAYPPMSQPQPMGGGNGGMGGNFPPRGGGTPFANNGSSNMMGAAVGGGGIGGVLGAFSNSASKALPSQVALNTYQQMGSYMGGNFQGISRSLLGSGGGGYNYMAQSMPDALAMGSTLQQASGSPYMGGRPGSLGQGMLGGAGGYQLGNPGMSGAAAASASAALFSPQTSWNMRLLGMQTPLGPGGQHAMTQAGVFNSFNQRFGLGKNVNQRQYASYMRQGGVGYQNVLNTLAGGNAQFAQQDINTMEMEHKLQLKGWSPGKIQNAIDAFSKGSPDARSAAQKQLKSAGIDTPDVSKIQAANAPNYARTADQAQGFSTGLSAATTTVQKFNTALASMMKHSGLDKYVGIGQGAASGTNALEPGFFHTASSVVSHIPIVGGMLSGAINAIGGGAAAPSGGSTIPIPKGGKAGSTTQQGGSANKALMAIHSAETQIGVPYVWGAEKPGKGFDCSGLTQWAYKNAGVTLPRTAAQQWQTLKDKAVPMSKVVAGDLVFAAGNTGSTGAPGHVGMMISNNRVIQAPHPGANVQITGFNASAWQHAARPTGSKNLSGKPNPAAPPGSGAATIPADAGSGISGSKGFGGGVTGLGDILSGGSTTEKSAVTSSVTGGIQGGSGYTGQNNGSLISIGGAPSTGGTGGFSGTGGKAVYTYLLNNVFGGNRAAAAGATASIWGESTWNPEAQGTGGRGLIGWTPASTLPNSAFTGNATKDMAAQLPLISKFIQTSGDQGAIAQMKAIKGTSLADVTNAANIWGVKVERFGINDVHSQGIALAMKIAGLATGGPGKAGQYAWVGERGPELVRFGQDAHVMNADQTAKIAKSSMAKSPQAPFVSGSGDSWQHSPLHPVYSGGKGQAGGFGNQIVLQFDENAIAIKMPAGTTDTGQSGRAMAEAFVNHVASTDLYKSIAQGKKT